MQCASRMRTERSFQQFNLIGDYLNVAKNQILSNIIKYYQITLLISSTEYEIGVMYVDQHRKENNVHWKQKDVLTSSVQKEVFTKTCLRQRKTSFE